MQKIRGWVYVNPYQLYSPRNYSATSPRDPLQEPVRLNIGLDPFEDMFRRFQKSVQDTLWPNPLEKREQKHKETPLDRFIPQIN